jgi:hypothetical protein
MKEGQYYYRPHRSMWGVWINHNHPNGITTGDFVKDFATKGEAIRFVYEKNGWDMKKLSIQPN